MQYSFPVFETNEMSMNLPLYTDLADKVGKEHKIRSLTASDCGVTKARVSQRKCADSLEPFLFQYTENGCSEISICACAIRTKFL